MNHFFKNLESNNEILDLKYINNYPKNNIREKTLKKNSIIKKADSNRYSIFDSEFIAPNISNSKFQEDIFPINDIDNENEENTFINKKNFRTTQSFSSFNKKILNDETNLSENSMISHLPLNNEIDDEYKNPFQFIEEKNYKNLYPKNNNKFNILFNKPTLIKDLEIEEEEEEEIYTYETNNNKSGIYLEVTDTEGEFIEITETNQNLKNVISIIEKDIITIEEFETDSSGEFVETQRSHSETTTR